MHSTEISTLARLRAALGKTALKAVFGAAVAVGVLGAGQAQALVVTVNGQQWDVTTITGDASFGPPPGNAPLTPTTQILVVQPWWTGSGANGVLVYRPGDLRAKSLELFQD